MCFSKFIRFYNLYLSLRVHSCHPKEIPSHPATWTTTAISLLCFSRHFTEIELYKMQSFCLACFTVHSTLGLICAIEYVSIGWISFTQKVPNLGSSNFVYSCRLYWLCILHSKASEFHIGAAELFTFSEWVIFQWMNVPHSVPPSITRGVLFPHVFLWGLPILMIALFIWAKNS